MKEDNIEYIIVMDKFKNYKPYKKIEKDIQKVQKAIDKEKEENLEQMMRRAYQNKVAFYFRGCEEIMERVMKDEKIRNVKKITNKREKKAVISFRLGNKLKLKLLNKDKGSFLFEIIIKDKTQIEDLIEILKNKKIEHIVIKNLGVVFKEKMDKIEVINKFTESNIKCFDLQNGCNNYIEEPIINEDVILNMITNHKKNLQLDKNKKTIAYMSLKDIKEDENATFYMAKQSEDIINKYAQENDLQISDMYIDHIPSRLDVKNRIALKNLLDKIKQEEIGQVLIPKMEHISRNTIMANRLINEICETGTKVVCCTDNLILG